MNFAVIVGNDDFFADHVDIRHAPDAPSRHDAFALFGEIAFIACIIAIFIAHATIEPAANAANALRIRCHALSTNLSHGDGIELPQKSPTTEQLPTRTETAYKPRSIAQPELEHFDTHLEFARQIRHHLAEIDANIGGEIDRDVFVIVAEIGRKHLHLEVLSDGKFRGEFVGAFFECRVFDVDALVVVVGDAHDERECVDFGDATITASDGRCHEHIAMESDENRCIGSQSNAICIDFDEALRAR